MKTCPLCSTTYTPKHASKAEAMATTDNESREQWISGCCSTACWDKHMKEPDEEPSATVMLWKITTRGTPVYEREDGPTIGHNDIRQYLAIMSEEEAAEQDYETIANVELVGQFEREDMDWLAGKILAPVLHELRGAAERLNLALFREQRMDAPAEVVAANLALRDALRNMEHLGLTNA